MSTIVLLVLPLIYTYWFSYVHGHAHVVAFEQVGAYIHKHEGRSQRCDFEFKFVVPCPFVVQQYRCARAENAEMGDGRLAARLAIALH